MANGEAAHELIHEAKMLEAGIHEVKIPEAETQNGAIHGAVRAETLPVRVVATDTRVASETTVQRSLLEPKARVGGALRSTAPRARPLASGCSNKRPRNALAQKNAASLPNAKLVATRLRQGMKVFGNKPARQ